MLLEALIDPPIPAMLNCMRMSIKKKVNINNLQQLYTPSQHHQEEGHEVGPLWLQQTSQYAGCSNEKTKQFFMWDRLNVGHWGHIFEFLHVWGGRSGWGVVVVMVLAWSALLWQLPV